MKKRKIYEKPSMEVYELKQQPQLLAGSSAGGEMNPLSPYAPDENPDPLNP